MSIPEARDGHTPQGSEGAPAAHPHPAPPPPGTLARMALPQQRTLTDAGGWRWLVTVDRGRLVLTRADGTGDPIVLDDPTDLRWFGTQLHRAVVEHDLDVQHAAAKASADRRQRRRLAGEHVGDRSRRFVEPPEPAMNLDPLVTEGLPA